MVIVLVVAVIVVVDVVVVTVPLTSFFLFLFFLFSCGAFSRAPRQDSAICSLLLRPTYAPSHTQSCPALAYHERLFSSVSHFCVTCLSGPSLECLLQPPLKAFPKPEAIGGHSKSCLVLVYRVEWRRGVMRSSRRAGVRPPRPEEPWDHPDERFQ